MEPKNSDNSEAAMGMVLMVMIVFAVTTISVHEAIFNAYYPPDYKLIRTIEAPVKSLSEDKRATHYIIVYWLSEEKIRRGGTFGERRIGKKYDKWRIANRESIPKEIIGKYLEGKILKLRYKIEKEGKIPVITIVEFKLK